MKLFVWAESRLPPGCRSLSKVQNPSLLVFICGASRVLDRLPLNSYLNQMLGTVDKGCLNRAAVVRELNCIKEENLSLTSFALLGQTGAQSQVPRCSAGLFVSFVSIPCFRLLN